MNRCARLLLSSSSLGVRIGCLGLLGHLLGGLVIHASAVVVVVVVAVVYMDTDRHKAQTWAQARTPPLLLLPLPLQQALDEGGGGEERGVHRPMLQLQPVPKDQAYQPAAAPCCWCACGFCRAAARAKADARGGGAAAVLLALVAATTEGGGAVTERRRGRGRARGRGVVVVVGEGHGLLGWLEYWGGRMHGVNWLGGSAPVCVWGARGSRSQRARQRRRKRRPLSCSSNRERATKGNAPGVETEDSCLASRSLCTIF